MSISNITNQRSNKGKEVDEFTRGMICALIIKANWKQVAVSKEFGIPTSTVHDIVKKYREKGQTKPLSRSGRPAIMTEREKRHLAISVRRSPFNPIGVHQQELAQATKQYSKSTIRKALAEKGLQSFRPALKPFLSRKTSTLNRR